MPLTYSSWEQVTAWRFLRHRAAVAIGRHSVRLVHDPSKNAVASLLVGAVAAALTIGVCFLISVLKPAGLAGGTDQILADRGSAGLYVRVGETMHPVLNLASARLIAGRPDSPKLVPLSQIEKFPMGPTVGIPGAPNDLVVRTSDRAGWGICDRLTGSLGARVQPRVTVLAGMPEVGEWAHEVDSPQAALMGYGGDVYVVSNGHRSKLDLADRPVTLALGITTGGLEIAPMSRALYEALAPTAPLRLPVIPEARGPVSYASAELPVVSGSVIRVTDATDTDQFFVALPGGVQPIPGTAAVAMSNADVSGQGTVVQTDPRTLSELVQTVAVDVSMFPPAPVQLLNKADEPVTCVLWDRGSGEPQARVRTVSGRRLPIPLDADRRVITLVSGPEHGSASEVYLGPDAPNFVQVTGAEAGSSRMESLWLITDSGVRFGVDTTGSEGKRTREVLGLAAAPEPAPWSVIRWLPAGPVLSRAAAMSKHDSLVVDRGGVVKPLTEEGR